MASTNDKGRPVPPHGGGHAILPSIHAPGGHGLTFCGRTMRASLPWAADPDEVTCPVCRDVMGLPPIARGGVT